MKYQINQQVEALDSDLEGVIIAIEQDVLVVETMDGFIMRFRENELIPLKALEVGAISSQVVKEKESLKSKKKLTTIQKKGNQTVLEVDLHIDKLVPRTKGLTNFDILNIQLDRAKGQLAFAMARGIQKVVFIHGVGEGVLKAELETLLRRYEHLKFYDADYKTYGLGATEVYIFQNRPS